MSELKDNISKMGIRSQANLIFSMMKLMVTVLDMAQGNKIARDTLSVMAAGVSEQASELQHDVGEYVAALSDGE